jgi:hypothetical protein
MTFISLGLGSWLNEDAEKFRSMTFNDSEVGSISFFFPVFRQHSQWPSLSEGPAAWKWLPSPCQRTDAGGTGVPQLLK